MLRDAAPVAEHLAADVFADGRGAVQLQQHVGLKQVFGSFDLEVSDGGAHPLPFGLNVEEHVFDVHAVADKVDAPQSGVLVARVKGLEGGAEVGFGHVLSQPGGVVGAAAHGTVPGPDHGVGNHQGDVVRVLPAAALDCEGDVGEGHVIVAHADVRPGVPARGVDGDLGVVGRADLAEVLRSQLAELVVVDTAGAGQHHSGALVVGLDVVNEVVTGYRLDVFGGAQNGAAERSSLIGNGVQMVENDLLQIHLYFLHFP